MPHHFHAPGDDAAGPPSVQCRTSSWSRSPVDGGCDIGPAARDVVDRVLADAAPWAISPLRTVSPNPATRRPGWQVEDALAALVICEQLGALHRPSAREDTGTWTHRMERVALPLRAMERADWDAVLPRYWGLLETYLPRYRRRPRMTWGMVGQLAAIAAHLSQQVPSDGQVSLAALAMLLANPVARAMVDEDGTCALRGLSHAVSERGGHGVPENDAQRLREHVRAATAFFCADAVTVGCGAVASGVTMHMTRRRVLLAVAHDARRGLDGDDGDEPLCMLGEDAGVVYGTIRPYTTRALATLVAERVAGTVDGLLDVYPERSVRSIADPRARAIVVRDAAQDIDGVCAVLRRLAVTGDPVMREAGNRLAAHLDALRAAAGPWTSDGPHPGRPMAGLTVQEVLARTNAALPTRRQVTLPDILDLVPSSAWMREPSRFATGPLDLFASGRRVRADVVPFLAMRFSRCAATRARGRVGLAHQHFRDACRNGRVETAAESPA